MNDFYDLNDLLAFMLRKIKLIIIIICVAVIGFASIRFVNLYKEYQNSKNQQNQADMKVETKEPMKVWKEINLNIRANYDLIEGTGISRGEEIASCYSALKNSASIMSELNEKYFELAEKDADQMREAMSKYGYILDKEKNNKYAQYDFSKQFQVNVYKNYVTIAFYSFDEEFAQKVVRDYEALLTQAVEQQYPDFEYTRMQDSVRYELPDVTAGALPSRATKGEVTTTIISKSMIVKQTIKGCVWGFLLGMVIVLIVVFLEYMMSKKIILWGQISRHNIKTYGLCYRKKVGILGKVKRKCIENLEGNSTAFEKVEEIVEIISSDIEARFPEKEKILICGDGDKKFTTEMVCLLNKQENKFELIESPLISSKGIQQTNNRNYVILLEIINVTVKTDIEKEIQAFNDYGIEIIGMVAVE